MLLSWKDRTTGLCVG